MQRSSPLKTSNPFRSFRGELLVFFEGIVQVKITIPFVIFALRLSIAWGITVSGATGGAFFPQLLKIAKQTNIKLSLMINNFLLPINFITLTPRSYPRNLSDIIQAVQLAISSQLLAKIITGCFAGTNFHPLGVISS